MKEKIINNILAWTIIIIIMNLLISFVFVSPYIDYKSEQYAYSSFYDNLQLDFNIPSPSRDQINELRRLNFIEKVIPYYYVGLDVNYSGNKRDSNILFFENMEDLKYIFSDNMEIYKGIESQNAIFADYYLARDLSMDINGLADININGKKIELSIGGIYKENLIYSDGVSGCIWNPSYVGNRYIPYSGAFIKAKDIAACENYLKNYKSLGRLRDRSEFQTDEAYNIHSNAIMSWDYNNEITDFNIKARNDINMLESNYLSVFVRCSFGTVILFLTFVLLNNFLFLKNKNNIEDILMKGADIREVKSFYTKIFLLTFIVSIIISAVCGNILSNNTAYYVAKDNIFIESHITGIASIFAIIISYISNTKSISKILKIVKIKNKKRKDKNDN